MVTRLLSCLVLIASAQGAVSSATVEETFASRAALLADFVKDSAPGLAIACEPQDARFVRLVIRRSSQSEPCLDELEIYGPSSPENLALASRGARASASSALPGHAIHAVPHLNDGLYGNDHSWIAATAGEEWAQIELPVPARIARVVISRDRTGKFQDRQVLDVEVRLSMDGQTWRTAGALSRTDHAPRRVPSLTFPVDELSARSWAGLVTYAFLRERDTWSRMNATDYLSPLLNDRPAAPGGPPYWTRLARLAPLERALLQFEEMIERMAKQGLDVNAERKECAAFRARAATGPASDQLHLDVRLAKRQLFFRDPRLAPLENVLFAKRHPFKPSHNYSEHLDSIFAPGGGIHVLRIPRDAAGRLDPARAREEQLFDGDAGIVRDPVADFDARTIYFAYRPEKPEVKGWQPYWHLMSVRADGSAVRQLTEGPFHDFDPVPLPDGGLGFITTRCVSRFLCWQPQAYVLYRMQPDGSGLRRLSHSNLSEWDPAVMNDGRIIWTRSEYQDKGADFGHTLWSIRPDGTLPELVFGNDTPYGYGHGREVPGSRELVCTLISHGDHQGPIVLIDPGKGLYNTAAITSITPDTQPQYQMGRSHSETFRDPTPLSRDHFLVSHNPGRRDHWCLYVIDRFGNRELLYADPAISSKAASPLVVRTRPPVFPDAIDPKLAAQGLGQFVVRDVYEGLGAAVPRGQVKYLAVSQEVTPLLEFLPCGEYRSAHPPFQDFYATPVHLVHGPPHSFTTRTANALQPHAFRAGSAKAAESGGIVVTERSGWPSYVAKAALGTVRVADDGSASFTAPSGRVLYFHLLDADFNELQRMRSVVQLQPGERRSCVGCHDDRSAAPRAQAGAAFTQPAQPLQPPPWGAGPFDYERVIQPVLDAACIRCHDGSPESLSENLAPDTGSRGLAPPVTGQQLVPGGRSSRDAGFRIGAKAKPDLRGQRDAGGVPASYRALIAGGWVHYFDWVYGSRPFKAEPLSFGTLQSPLFAELANADHASVKLADEQRRALKAWIDLNCPLWPDYRYRPDRL
jgi:hypothetical protein